MTEKTHSAKAIALPEGEGAILLSFTAIPVIWTSFVVPMTFCDICLRSLALSIGSAAFIGLTVGVVREVVIGREAP